MARSPKGEKRPDIDWRSVAFPSRLTCAKCLKQRSKLARAGLNWDVEFECRRCDYIRDHVACCSKLRAA